MNVIGLSQEDLLAYIQGLGLPSYRSKQLWRWVYHFGVRNFELMTNLSKHDRKILGEKFSFFLPSIKKSQVSKDGTQKWLLKFSDQQETETVHIPEEQRGTLCISSQVGCTLSCRFCHTGTQTLVRNLESSEIVGQIMVARNIFSEWPAPDQNRHVSNIVMMGMGEPLYNYNNVAKAIKIMTNPEGINISRHKITLSTSGVVSMMKQCATELGVGLAVSLHAVNNDIRNEIIPLNKKYPLEDLLEACLEYSTINKSRKITFEYVMLKGVNDSDADARALIHLIKGIPAKINLIPFNPWPNSPYECSSKSRIRAFGEIIKRAGYASPIRKTRG